MKRIALMLVLVYGFGGWPIRAQDREMRTTAGTFATTLAKLGKKSVAVVDFTDLQGNVTELGRYLAEQMSIALALTDQGIEVVDRTHLKAIVQENKLSASGLIDPSTALKLGQLAGVQVLVTGTLTPFGDSVQLAIKALDATTARIIAASTSDVAKTKAIEDLLNRGVTSPLQRDGRLSPVAGSSTPNTAQLVETLQLKFAVSSCRLDGSSAAQSTEQPTFFRREVERGFQAPQKRGNPQGSHLTCRLTVFNEGDDRDLTFYAQWNSPPATRLIDGNGVETNADEVQIGGKARGDHASGTVVAGVSTVVVLGFDHVPSDISSIALLDISCSVEKGSARRGGFRAFKVQFRAIPVVR